MREIAEIAAAAAEFKPVTAEEAEALIRAVHRTCRGELGVAGRKEVQAHLDAGNLEDAQFADAIHRKPCGQDINDVILELPLDGSDHNVACPKCGLVISLRTPVFTIEE